MRHDEAIVGLLRYMIPVNQSVCTGVSAFPLATCLFKSAIQVPFGGSLFATVPC